MRTFWLRLLCLLALVAVAVPSARANREWLCRMSGRVVAACCCGLGPAVEARSGAPQAERGSCCRRVQGDERAAAASARAPEPDSSFAIALQESVPIDLGPRNAAPNGSLRCAQAAPRGPPLFLVHCALLL